MPTDNRPPSQYPVIVHNVKEVSLYGSADLPYWRAFLQREGLVPLDDHGQAQLLLIAADMVWNRVRFTELSFSVALARPGAPEQRAGMYLIQAFNSVRWFAWVERTFFQTPYYHAVTRVSPQSPIAIELHAGPTVAFRAALASTPLRAPASRGPETFSGPVVVPSALSKTPRAEKLFLAELSGETDIYPFASGDSLQLAPTPVTPVVQRLIDSRFAGTAWHVRAAATHKKSPTMRAESAVGAAALSAP